MAESSSSHIEINLRMTIEDETKLQYVQKMKDWGVEEGIVFGNVIFVEKGGNVLIQELGHT